MEIETNKPSTVKNSSKLPFGRLRQEGIIPLAQRGELGSAIKDTLVGGKLRRSELAQLVVGPYVEPPRNAPRRSELVQGARGEADYRAVMPRMKEDLTTHLNKLVGIAKDHPDLLAKGTPFEVHWMLAQSLMDTPDSHSVSDAKVERYLLTAKGQNETLILMEDRLDLMSDMMGKSIFTEGRSRKKFDPNSQFTKISSFRNVAGAGTVASGVAAGAGLASGVPAAFRAIGTLVESTATKLMQITVPTLQAAQQIAQNVGVAGETGLLVGGVAVGGALVAKGVNELVRHSYHDARERNEVGLEAVQKDQKLCEQIQLLYGIDPRDLTYDGNRLEFKPAGTNSPSWKAQNETYKRLSDLRRQYYKKVIGCNLKDLDASPVQYLREGQNQPNQLGANAHNEVIMIFNRMLIDKYGDTKIYDPAKHGGATRDEDELAAERVSLYYAARREYMSTRFATRLENLAKGREELELGKKKALLDLKERAYGPDGSRRKAAKKEITEKIATLDQVIGDDTKGITKEVATLRTISEITTAVAHSEHDIDDIVSKYHTTKKIESRADNVALLDALNQYIYANEEKVNFFGNTKESLIYAKVERLKNENERHDKSVESIDKLLNAASSDALKAQHAREMTTETALHTKTLEEVVRKYDDQVTKAQEHVSKINAAMTKLAELSTRLDETKPEGRGIKVAIELMEKSRVIQNSGLLTNTSLATYGIDPKPTWNELMTAANTANLWASDDNDKTEFQMEMVGAIVQAKLGSKLNGYNGNESKIVAALGLRLLTLTPTDALVAATRIDSTITKSLTEAQSAKDKLRSNTEQRQEMLDQVLRIMKNQKINAETKEGKAIDAEMDRQQLFLQIARDRLFEGDSGAMHEGATTEMGTADKMRAMVSTRTIAVLSKLPQNEFYSTLSQSERDIDGLSEGAVRLLGVVFGYGTMTDSATLKDKYDRGAFYDAILEGLGPNVEQKLTQIIAGSIPGFYSSSKSSPDGMMTLTKDEVPTFEELSQCIRLRQGDDKKDIGTLSPHVRPEYFEDRTQHWGKKETINMMTAMRKAIYEKVNADLS
ncbi:MAG: hypothetical protein WCJ70_04095 [bacterium]